MTLLSVTTGLLFIMCCSVAFDVVLGGVMGIVCSVVFGVLSNFCEFNMIWNFVYDNLW